MITVYGKPGCPNCKALKMKLDKNNIEYQYIDDIEVTMMRAKELEEKGVTLHGTPFIIDNDGNAHDYLPFMKSIQSCASCDLGGNN